MDIRKLNRAIIEDKQLHQLYLERVKIYTFITPTMILRDGKATLIWLDETNSERLKQLDEIIQHRIDQIVNFYSN